MTACRRGVDCGGPSVDSEADPKWGKSGEMGDGRATEASARSLGIVVVVVVVGDVVGVACPSYTEFPYKAFRFG